MARKDSAKREGRRPLIAGNWKMNMTHLDAIGLVQKLAFTIPEKILDDVEVVVLPPFTALRSVQTLVTGTLLARASHTATAYARTHRALSGR